MRSITHIGSPSRPGRVSWTRRVWRLPLALGVAFKVRCERRMLLRLDDRPLTDMGFNRGDAHVEAQRSFWDIPIDRLRR